MSDDIEDMIKYGSFEEKGYTIEAYMTSSGQSEWYVKAIKDNKVVKEIRIPMMYTPVFGPDVSDVSELEQKTDELLKELP
ncbi:MAG: hypothetical protein AABX39_04710 [Nanoarchaeota archaeon]